MPDKAEQGSPALALWGGAECTLNRVHGHYFDQSGRTGHRERMLEDLGRFRDLGIRTLRVCLHWELAHLPESWVAWDAMLKEMARLEITPIVGLIHHGSGPPDINLLDAAFPEKLAAFALEVARRHPDVLDYTPVNEAQTTARFSCLYGLWYPHERSMKLFVRAMYHQIKGVVLAMQAVRTVQPRARLIHTEDGGATFSTPRLESYRVEREHRRWLGTDLLCGRVTAHHPLFRWLGENGLTDDEILWFARNACPPSVVGLNYYVTSDRFLDHRVELYTWGAGGDTGAEPLVDVEAARVRRAGIGGACAVLTEAWRRYGLPVAITEAHLGCEAAEEQVRWLAEIWREARQAIAEGVDVRAVTVWSMLGSYNWSRLCTDDAGTYEAGVFDLTSGRPEETPLTDLVRCLAAGRTPHGEAEELGWWRRPDRLTRDAV